MNRILNFIKKNKKTGLLFVMAAFFFPLAVKAGVTMKDITGFDNPGTLAALSVGKLIEYYVSAIGWLVLQLVYFVIKVAQYNNFVNSMAVAEGWTIVRDVVNMFFILILIVMAFGTIFQSGTYHWRKMLPRLLIMAVVINFSRTICGLLIDLGQVVMLTFVNGFQAAAGGNFINALRIRELLEFNVAALTGEGSETINIVYVFVGYLLAAIMITVTAVVLIVMLMILVMRVITLWFLIVLSPLAFLASVWPSGRISQKYGQWWDMFLDNILVGPILAFFLWLSLLVLGSGQVAGDFNVGAGSTEAEYAPAPNVGYTKIGEAESMISYILGIGMLLGSLYMAQSMRAAGAGIAGKALSGIRGYASGALRKTYRAPYRATRFAVKRGIGAAYEVSGARARVDLGVSKFRDTGFARVLGMGKKEHYDKQKLKRDEAAARQFGDTGKANAIRKKIEAGELASVREKEMTNDALGSNYKIEKDVYKKSALAREMASRGMIKGDNNFKKYAAGDRNLEFSLRREAETGVTKDKDAWIGFQAVPNKPADISGQTAMAYAKRSRTEREDWYKDAAKGTQIGADGNLNDKFIAEKLGALQMSDFEKFSSGSQSEILEALAALEKTAPGEFSSLGLDRKFKEMRDAAKVSGKPQLDSERGAIENARNNLHTVPLADRQRMLKDRGAIDYLDDKNVAQLDPAVQTPEVLSDLANAGRLDALIKSGNINIANLDLTANDGALARAILSSGSEELKGRVRRQRGNEYQAGLAASMAGPGDHGAARRELLKTGANARAIYGGQIDTAGTFQDAETEETLLNDLKGVNKVDDLPRIVRKLKGEAKESALGAFGLEDIKKLFKQGGNEDIIREFLKAASKDTAGEDMKAALTKLSNLNSFKQFMPPKPGGGGGGGAGAGGGASSGGGSAGGGGGRARISDAAIKAIAEINYQRRLAGIEPGFTHTEIDQMLRDKGITPGTPEADKFMSDWDWDMAKKELGA